MDSEKACSKCGITRSLGDFYKRPGGRVNPWCKICYKDWYASRNGGVVRRACDHCGKVETVTGRRAAEVRFYCTRWCKDRARKDQAIAEREAAKPTGRICMHCGNQLPQRMRTDAIFCSEKCNYSAHALQRKLRARTGEEGKPGYLRAFICERDRWRCGICHEPVDRRLQHPELLCASLDHVIPVSEGGTNDVWNLRLTHLRCNLSRRNAGGNEQLAMF